MSNKKPPPDYESKEAEMWKVNAKQVPARLSSNDENIVKRVKTYIERFGYPQADVNAKVMKDEMFAANFTLEPRRQSLHEKIAAEWLKELALVSQFKILPKTGKEAIYISGDGNIQKNLANPPSKSLDFEWMTGKVKVYAMHKYTKEGGGNQDSQYKEMINLLKNFIGCSDKGCILLIIVDGRYYNHNRMERLSTNTRTHPPRSYAIQIEAVPEILEAYE